MQSNSSYSNAYAATTRVLREVAADAHQDTTGVDGIGVTVLLGDRSVFGGSNPFTESVDQLQYGLNQGPCVTAAERGRAIRSTRVGAGEWRWPVFSPRAAGLGLRSVTSLPCISDGKVVGSLNVYSRTAGGLDALKLVVLRRLARTVEAASSSARLLALVEATAWLLADALRERADVEVAVGVVMDTYRVNATQARTLIDQLARQDGITQAEAARSVSGVASAW